MRGDRIWLGVGGGVVADSEGAAEAREAAAKAAPLLAAIGAAVPRPAARRHAPACARAAGRGRCRARTPPRASSRPLLVEDGVAAHLRRSSRAARREPARRLWRAAPPELAVTVAAAARALTGRARLRVDVTPELEVAS